MRLRSSFLWLALIESSLLVESSNIRARDYDARDYYALHLSRETSPDLVARHFGLELEGPIGQLTDHHLFSAPKGPQDVVTDRIEDYRRRKKRAFEGELSRIYNSILFAEKQKLKKLVKRSIPPRQGMGGMGGFTPDQGGDPGALAELKELAKALDIQDPIFHEQWHLFNTVQRGFDVNVTGVWSQGIFGKNTTVSIVDDGLDMDSEDLKDNYFAAGSWDFNDNVPAPKPRLVDDRHGTRCAGEIGAVKNNVCGVGVAWESKVSGIRILSKQITDADEAIALNYAFQDNHIYSCSWGPPDDGQSMDAPGILIKRAMVNGIQNGRDGLGSIFVFASGNGAGNDDNCNFDGYTNSIYSITVGAVDRMGKHPYYSESCSANLVVTYSSGSGDAIHTTDVGPHSCFSNHGGTSAAAPLAAGIFALALSVRPDLSWRDMQYLCVETAVMVDEDDPDWETTFIGKHFSHRYGYGSLDAYAIVEKAKTWQNVKPQAWFHTPILEVKAAIPQGNTGLRSHVSIDAEDLKKANFERIEHVTVTMNVKHQQRGDVSVDLISPKGMVSHIATVRRDDSSEKGYDNWTFMSVKHWGEDGVGDWTIIVKDKDSNQYTGSLVDWKLTLWGECIDAEQAVLHPLPGDSMNQTHPIQHPVVSAPHGTTTLPPITTTEAPLIKPTDHITRPVNSKIKPSGSGSADSSSSTSDSTAAPAEETTDTADSSDPAAATTDPNDGFIPSFLPSFGVSGKAQVWIYGAIVVIISFVSGVGIYLCVQKKKRKENSGDYEFAVLQDEEEGSSALGGIGGVGSSRGTGVGGGGRSGGAGGVGGRRKKARELYDAFGASDDEEDVFSLDEDDDEKYRSSRDYDLEEEEAVHGVDEGKRETGTDRERLLGSSRD